MLGIEVLYEHKAQTSRSRQLFQQPRECLQSACGGSNSDDCAALPVARDRQTAFRQNRRFAEAGASFASCFQMIPKG
mgnify:CR=1 FL=1